MERERKVKKGKEKRIEKRDSESLLRIEKKDRKIDSEQVLTCEHTVSGYWKEKEKEKKKERIETS